MKPWSAFYSCPSLCGCHVIIDAAVTSYVSEGGLVYLHLLATCWQLHTLPSGDKQPLLDCYTSNLLLNLCPISETLSCMALPHGLMLYGNPLESLSAPVYLDRCNII